MLDNILENKINTKKISFFVISAIFIILILILIDFFIRKIIYIKNPGGGFLYTYAKVRNIPAIRVYGDKISYVTFKDILDKDKNFYKKVYEFSEEIPNEEYIKNIIEKKFSMDIIVKNLCKKYDINIDDRELYNETKKYIESFGSEENLNNSLLNYYNVDITFFQENYIKPYLLKNKLNDFIRNDDKINKDSVKKIKEVQNKINNGEDFLKLAKYYNEDARLQESSGVINWISKEDLKYNFETIENIELEKNYISKILKNKNGYYIIKILDVSNLNIKNQKIKLAVIKMNTIDLNQYLQKQYNNIKIREYIN